MKICIPIIEDNGFDSKVNLHFGSAPSLFIYDTEDQSHLVARNGNYEHEHGTCQPAAAIAGLDVDAVVCSGMGLRAVQMLNRAGVKVFRTEHIQVADIINDFQLETLTELTPQDACTEHHCG